MNGRTDGRTDGRTEGREEGGREGGMDGFWFNCNCQFFFQRLANVKHRKCIFPSAYSRTYIRAWLN